MAAELRAQDVKPLYRGLRPGPHGLERSREEVLRHQRTRLLGAMIEAVAQRGYAAVTVQQLVTLAGVSKRSFYEHFTCKEDCFLATFDTLSEAALRRLAAAYARQGDRDVRLRTMLEWVLANIADRPREARLRMIEALAAGPVAGERVEQMRTRVECVIASSLPSTMDGSSITIVPKAITAGLWHVVCTRLFDGTTDSLPELAEELYGWMHAYDGSTEILGEMPSLGKGRGVAAVCKPPGGDERRRLRRAALELAGRYGWMAVTHASVIELADVSEHAFAKHYGGVDECFLDALDLLAAETLAPMLAAARAAPREWPATVTAAIRSLLRSLAEDPPLAQVAFVEALAFGPTAAARVGSLLDKFAGFLERSAPPQARASSAVSQAIAGAVWGVLHDYVAAGAADRLTALASHLSYVVLAPVMGAEAAVEAITSAEAVRPTEVNRLGEDEGPAGKQIGRSAGPPTRAPRRRAA